MILHFVPIWFVDVFGSLLMILLSFLCLRLVFNLKLRDPNNVIWAYLLWFCIGLSGFAISRSAGHLLKDVLLVMQKEQVWAAIRPYSGAINTTMLALVAAVTLFFERTWKIYQQILKDKQTLQETNKEVVYLNQNLEQLVHERTHELAVSEHKYRRIFEISKDIIMVSRRDGTITDINPFGYELLGREEASPVGRSFAEFIADGHWEHLIKEIDEHGSIFNAEVDLICQDDTIRHALVSASLDRGRTETEGTIHYLVKDIEQRRLMELQIAQADKLASLGQLSAGVAHEINNPMGIILGYTQLLLREESPDSEKHSDLKIIEKHVKNCKAIVEDLLSFSRSSKTEEKKHKIHEIIDEVLNFVKQHAKVEHLEIIRKYDEEVPVILLDEKKIKQVFINLIMNASHAIGGSGTIEIRTNYDQPNESIQVQVSDSGHGISKANMKRIFDPFFTTKPTGEGTGLGLSVSYGIIKNHGGEITVESEPGEGSTFTVILPVKSP
ncbi:MAG: ATP-binding protein [Desulfobacteraceae bacterium]|jgi:PAS domain S-box-containing protein